MTDKEIENFVMSLFAADNMGHAVKLVRAALSHQGEVVKSRCPYCDDTGDVHSIDGEWRGSCDCCKVVKVSDLRALADTWEGFTKAFDRPDSGYTNEKIVGHRRALTHDLTALISKAEKV